MIYLSILLVLASTFCIVQHHRGVLHLHPLAYWLNVIGIVLQTPQICLWLAWWIL